ncbi:MAG TPA: hypothetical protein VM537_28055 [Anaerolineae bacterium]|jgi:hypothetical protein|nr:hypothetical protein [Anaerolineae bacterium]
MRESTRRFLYWTPRILTILFALFISVFALDVFGEGYGVWGTIVALVMHLIPTFLILIALAVSWRWEWVGAALFFALAIFYLVIFRGEVDWITFLLIPGPLFLVGVLFGVNWLLRDKLRAHTMDRP